ncbi:MAG: carboxypeptidase-like regulatory domain-containing protein [Bacteroidia bacterium]|nr:carboxypeptidase-like regulatory domain-containing protein [Bacteroidia bacterium]
MKHIVAILIFVLFLILNSFAQNDSYILSGTILESGTDKPIEKVAVKTGKPNAGVYSDKNGKFKIFFNQFPVEINFSHLAYEIQTITFREIRKEIKVYMTVKNTELPPVTVSADKVINLVAKKLLAVNDYEFMGKNILMLVYNYNYLKDKNPWLVLMNKDGDTLCSTPIGSDGKFYKDCMGNLHLVTDREAYQVFYDSTRFHLIYPAPKEEFFKGLEPCIANIENYYYLKNYSFRNQVLTYYKANISDTSYEKMRVIADDAGMRMLVSRDRFFAMGTNPPTEADIRFEEMCFFDPVYAPMYKVDGQLVIFNFVDSKLEFYSETGTLEKDVRIDFHKSLHWEEAMFIDEVCKRAYTLYVKDGISSLCEISLQTGKPGRQVKIPKFKFINKIKVCNNRVYFLYRKTTSDDLMALYVMELDS